MADTVMLALSTFRHSEKAVELAIAEARTGAELLVVWVVDVNLARYLVDTDAGLLAEVRERTERQVLADHERQARQRVETIAEHARRSEVAVRSHVEVGRFALVCLPLVRMEKPRKIFTTRSDRPAWVRRFFGSPVDQLIAEAGCPVIEA